MHFKGSLYLDKHYSYQHALACIYSSKEQKHDTLIATKILLNPITHPVFTNLPCQNISK